MNARQRRISFAPISYERGLSGSEAFFFNSIINHIMIISFADTCL